MKYLFFDIECSNCFGGIGKMCEFGYVLTDENFNIISAQDIPMSPGRGKECKFNLRDRMKEEDINLAYDEDFYFDQPELPTFHGRIKKLMEDKNTICFAFSMGNDIRYLYDSCARYKLEPINYICYDIQQIAAKHLNRSGQPGLAECVKQIVGPHAKVRLVDHLSRDDAKMEMMIMQAICELHQIDSKTLLDKSEYAKVNSIDFIKEFKEKQARNRVKSKLKLVVEGTANGVINSLFDENYIGKRYGIHQSCYTSIEEFKEIVKVIRDIGGVFSKKYKLMDHLIVKDEETVSFLKEKVKDIYSGDYILLSDITSK